VKIDKETVLVYSYMWVRKKEKTFCSAREKRERPTCHRGLHVTQEAEPRAGGKVFQ